VIIIQVFGVLKKVGLRENFYLINRRGDEFPLWTKVQAPF